jgi:hypothetical protein
MSIDQPQPGATASAGRANGVATYFGVLFSPGEAFDTLSRIPMWGWAALLGLVIIIIGSIIGLPATIHVAQVAQQAQIAQQPADQQQTMRDTIAKTQGLLPVFIFVGAFIFPWVSWVITALVIMAGAAIGRGAVNFGNAWVLSVNTFIIPALGQLIANTILRLQGAENISKASDAYALPSLAMIVHGDPKTAAVLYAFNVINLWYYFIFAMGLQRVMKMSAAAAWTTTIVFAAILALIAMAFAK